MLGRDRHNAEGCIHDANQPVKGKTRRDSPDRKDYGVSNIRVLGSVARGEADEKSDIDLLVDMEPGRNLLDLIGFLKDLESLLGCKVDVVTEKGLRERIRERVLKEAVAL